MTTDHDAAPTWSLRCAGAGDVDALQRFVAALSLRTRVQRFFAPLRELPAELVERLRRGDVRHRFVVAASTSDAAIVALGDVAWTEAPPAPRAELGLVLADAWQGRGLGRALLERLAAEAVRGGAREALLEVLATNRAMLSLAARCGFALAAHPGDDDLVLATRRLDPSPAAPPRPARRGVVAQPA